MTLHGKGILTELKRDYADVRSQVDSLIQEIEDATWQTPIHLKARYPKASILSDNRVVFDLKGTKYRVLTKVSFKNQIVMVLEAGTHQKYDKWDMSKER